MLGDNSMSTFIVVAIAALVILVLIAVVYFAMRPRTRAHKPREYNAELTRRRLALEDLRYTIIHDVKVRDSSNRVIRVDHVIRLPASVLLVTSAPPDVAGPVKPNQNAGTWRYIADGARVANMPNPVLQLHPLVQAVRSRFPLVRIRVLTVFPATAQIAAPTRTVCMAEDFIKLVKEMATEDGVESQAIEAAWEPLSKALLQSSQGLGNKGGGSGTAPRRAVS
jgi:hypothetical protein